MRNQEGSKDQGIRKVKGKRLNLERRTGLKGYEKKPPANKFTAADTAFNGDLIFKVLL